MPIVLIENNIPNFNSIYIDFGGWATRTFIPGRTPKVIRSVNFLDLYRMVNFVIPNRLRFRVRIFCIVLRMASKYGDIINL